MNEKAQKNISSEETACILCGSESKRIIACGFDYQYWTSEMEFSYVECTHCGHIFLNPRPTPGSWPIIYPSNYYTLSGRHSKRSSRIVAFAKRHIIRKRLYDFNTLLKNPSKILEVGCGDCSLLLDLKTLYPNIQLTGVDMRFNKETRHQCAESGIKLIEGRIEDVLLQENEYDLIIMNQLVEHLWDPVEVLTKLRKSLTAKGMVSIETINTSGYDKFFFPKKLWGGYYFPRHLNLFSFESLKRFLDSCGLTTVKQYSLVAPIVWIFSVRALICPRKKHANSLLRKFVSDGNPFCLVIFTIIDIFALILGLKTSNQKTVCRQNKCDS